jgi:broad specificity phosphatase PhoE
MGKTDKVRRIFLIRHGKADLPIISSPCERALKTAEILAELLKKPVSVQTELLLRRERLLKSGRKRINFSSLGFTV